MLGLFLQVEGGMDYKAKAVAGLLAATCVFSIIALILSVVNVKDVFLPPSTKVGSLEGAHLPAFTWLLAAPWCRIFPRFQAGCAVCHCGGDNLPRRLACQVGLAEFGHCDCPYSTYSLFIAEHCQLKGLVIEPCP